MPLLPRCVFAPLSMGRRTHQRFVGRTGTPLGAPQQVFTTGARGMPPFTSPMTEEFHRTRPKIFRFAVTKAPPERVAMEFLSQVWYVRVQCIISSTFMVRGLPP